MFDLKKMLDEDPIYKAILSSLKDEEKKYLEKYMDNFLTAWQNGVFTPLKDKIKDDEFKKELLKKLDTNG